MDFITYSRAKKALDVAEGAISGVKSVTVNGTSLHFVFNDGSTDDMFFPNVQGTSIVGVNVDENKHLFCTLSDGTVVDAGEVPTVKGDDGNVNIRPLTNLEIEELLKD